MSTPSRDLFRFSRRAFVLAALVFAAACTAVSTHQRPKGPVRVVVLHTNDMHGQVLPRKATWLDKDAPPLVGGLPRVAAFVTRARREARMKNENLLVLDGGDWYQGTPEGVLDLGLPCVRAISAIGYDAVSLGNHDFDHGVENLRRLLREARPPAICANLRDPSTGARVAWVEPWKIVERGGLRFALVGLLTPSTPSITHPDAKRLLFSDPVEELARVELELAGRYDVMIVLGHVGVEEGRAIAAAQPDIPLIVTGHSHTRLREGRREGTSLIVQAGAKAGAVGRVELEFDGPSAGLLESSARLIDLDQVPDAADRNAAVDSISDELARRAEREMQEVVGELAAPLRAGGGPLWTVAGSWVADLLRERSGAEVAFHNRGGTRAEIEAGPVTRRDVFEMLPFDNDVVRFRLLGSDLLAVVRQAIEGTAHSGLDFSGLVAYVRADEREGRTHLTLQRVEVGGAQLDPEREYLVATNSFLAAGGDAFEALERATDRSEDPLLLRDLAVEAFLRQGRVVPPGDARIVAVEREP